MQETIKKDPTIKLDDDKMKKTTQSKKKNFCLKSS